MKKGSILNDLLITDMAFGGKGIAKLDTEKGDFIVFVNNSLPGQRVQARIRKKKKRYAEAKLLRVVQPAPEEQPVPFQPIPGAPFARLPIAQQEQYKEQATLQMFRRIAEQENIEDLYQGYTGSPLVWHYRNKMEYSFSTLISDVQTQEETEGFALGFKRRGQWWAVEQLNNDSGLFDQELEQKLHHIRQFCENTGLPAWNPGKRSGFFRFLVARKSFHQDQLLLNLVTHNKGLEDFPIEAFVEKLKELLGERLAGLWHTVNPNEGDRVSAQEGSMKLLYGKPKLVEKVLGLSFEISMLSFFQTNPRCAERLYQHVVDEVKAGLPEKALVMDLFCGTGTIAQLLASDPRIEEVIGVDIVESAIEDARENAKRNGVSGLRFFAADVGKFLLEYPEYSDKIHSIVLDPPRAGIAPKTLRKVMRLNAQRIIYVSCNPSTQARDSLALREAGYTLSSYRLVDQFPHTSHIESIGVFERSAGDESAL